VILATRWEPIAEPPAQAVQDLARGLNLPATLARLLVQRGYGSAERARGFLRPALGELANPLDLPDMERAVAVVAEAVRAGKPIVVHGDYDVDGQCGTALLTRVLRAAGAPVVPFIPNRMRDGYDLGPAGVARAREVRAGVIVTVDCGVTAREAIADARAAGIRVVVTDHHLPGELPAADAIVNPRRGDPEAPTADLCGTGVAFKLAQALVPALGLPDALPFHFLDLVALATIADVVPLTRENRILTRFGLKKLADSRWPGVRALIETAKLAGTEIKAGHVGFVLAPRLNAAGRIGDATDGLDLLLCDDPADALERARRLETVNTRRQELDQGILDQALTLVEREADLDRDYGLVLAQDGWHPGVIGIVASRIVERYARPTILVALDGPVGKGSGRSIPKFDLHGALVACGAHLGRFGGHRMAAGLTVSRDRLDGFRLAFNEYARAHLRADDLVAVQRIDAVVAFDALDFSLEKLLRHLEPCGPGNPAPVFGVSGVAVREARPVGTNHLRLLLEDPRGRLTTIGFDWADRVDPTWWTAPVDVAFRLERNEYRGDVSLQGRIIHVRPSVNVKRET
jgi:single-stranded-DNA-specific exonuclease